MKKVFNKYGKIDTGSYYVPVYLVIGDEKFQKRIQTKILKAKSGIEFSIDAFAETIPWYGNIDHSLNMISITYSSFDKKDFYDLASLAHEAVHVKNLIFESRGIKLDYNNDEASAYLVGYLVEQCLMLIDKWSK